MTPTDLLKEIHQADWPAVVNVAPSDFFALVLQMGIAPESGEDSFTRFFWAGPTKVASSAVGYLDLRGWQPPLIEIPKDTVPRGGIRLA